MKQPLDLRFLSFIELDKVNCLGNWREKHAFGWTSTPHALGCLTKTRFNSQEIIRPVDALFGRGIKENSAEFSPQAATLLVYSFGRKYNRRNVCRHF